MIGDTATIDGWHGKPVPGIAPAAKQQGRHVATTIKKRLRGDASPRPFRYKHSGSLATIGRNAAVAMFGKLELSGYPAWLMWLAAHIYFLINFRNRIAVMIDWAWSYFTHQRYARIIIQGGEPWKTPRAKSPGDGAVS